VAKQDGAVKTFLSLMFSSLFASMRDRDAEELREPSGTRHRPQPARGCLGRFAAMPRLALIHVQG